MSVFKRKGSPYWWVSLTTHDGQRIRQSTKYRRDADTAEQRADNKRKAEIVLHELYTEQADIQHGRKPKIVAKTFKEFALWYGVHVSAHKRGADEEAYVLKTLIAHFGEVPLASLRRQDYQEWMTARREAVKASTVNREVDVLKHLLQAAVPKFLDASPLEGLARLRPAPTEAAVLSRLDEARLLKVLPPHDKALVIVAIDSLIREADLLKLTWADDHGTFLDVSDPKEDNPYQARVSRRVRTELNAIKPHPARGRIFPHYDHKDAVLRMFKKACKQANVTYGRTNGGVTFHSLRHTGATRMGDAGVSAPVIMKAGGWKDIRSVARYTHPSAKALDKAVNAIGKGVR